MAGLASKDGTLMSGWCMTGHHEGQENGCRRTFSVGDCPCDCHSELGDDDEGQEN